MDKDQEIPMVTDCQNSDIGVSSDIEESRALVTKWICVTEDHVRMGLE